MHTDMFSYLHAQTCIKTFMPSKIRKKDWAKWAKWARILKNTLTDEHPCFLAFACSDKYQNIYSFFQFNIRKKNWAKWVKWARILQNSLTGEQLCSLTCFLIFTCSHQNIYSSHQKYKNKDWTKWAKWARMLENTLTDEQWCSLICLFCICLHVSEYLMIHHI